tara:strand:- start:11118 stop:11354 length:237 start_codon:yes stop_codon:yes gene_type:complete
MSNQQYKNIGKKQIINVVSQLIQKVEAVEMTLNLLIMFVDKDKKFDAFMKEKLGGANESSKNGTTDSKGDTPADNKDS